MNAIKLKETWFGITDDGINTDGTIMKLTLVLGDVTVEELEGLLDPLPEKLEIYSEDHVTKTGEFNGFTVLVSLEKYFTDNIATVTFSIPSAQNLLHILMGE